MLPAAALAAHEWRAAWGAPYPLPHIEESAAGGSDSLRIGFALERPFGLTELSFQRVRLALPLIDAQVHGGSLAAPAYREWHIGVGRWIQLAEHAELLVGGRLFGIAAGNETHALHGAGTLIGRARPPRLGFMRIEGGLVDFGSPADAGGPRMVALCRIGLQAAGSRVVIERLVLPGTTAETNLAVSFDHHGLRFGCALRCGIGEASLALALRRHSLEVAIAQRWHPQLGWTPVVGLGWSGGE